MGYNQLMDDNSNQPVSLVEQYQAPVSLPPEMPISPKKLTPKLLAIIVAALVLAGIAYGGYWYWQEQDLIVPPSPSPADETSEWKTYRNERYGFEIKYPASKPINEYESNVKNDNLFFSLDIDYKQTNGDMGGFPVYLRLDIVPTSQKTDCVGEYDGTLTIGGFLTGRCLNSGSYFGEGEGLWVDVIKDELKYVFRADFYDINRGAVDNIIATFKFTSTSSINSFNACVAAGYPIMESYPEKCQVPGGPIFTK